MSTKARAQFPDREVVSDGVTIILGDSGLGVDAVEAEAVSAGVFWRPAQDPEALSLRPGEMSGRCRSTAPSLCGAVASPEDKNQMRDRINAIIERAQAGRMMMARFVTGKADSLAGMPIPANGMR